MEQFELFGKTISGLGLARGRLSPTRRALDAVALIRGGARLIKSTARQAAALTGANPTCVGQVLRLNDEQRRAVERGHVLLASTMRRRTPVPPKPLTAILTDEELIEVVRANGIEKVIAALEAVMRAKVAA